MILAAVTLIIQLLPSILQGVGVISPAMSALITQLGSAVPGLITSLSSGKPVSDDVLALLSAMRTELATLAQDTNLSPHALGMVNTLILGVSNALVGYEAAETTDDPSTLTPLPTNVEPPAISSAAVPAAVVPAAVVPAAVVIPPAAPVAPVVPPATTAPPATPTPAKV